MTTELTLNDHLVELGTLENNEDKARMRVGARLIEKFFDEFKEYHVMDREQIANHLYYLTDIQVRDYALGLLSKDKAYTQEYALRYLLEAAPTDTPYINAPAALLAVLEYQLHHNENAFTALSNASDDYSLAQLLRRVFAAGWAPSAFVEMQEELHPKVVAHIFGKGENNE